MTTLIKHEVDGEYLLLDELVRGLGVRFVGIEGDALVFMTDNGIDPFAVGREISNLLLENNAGKEILRKLPPIHEIKVSY